MCSPRLSLLVSIGAGAQQLLIMGMGMGAGAQQLIWGICMGIVAA